MDGNGRWATQRGRPRGEGHEAGGAAVHRAVEAALEQNVETLTLYTFSSDNWRRPAREVLHLMKLFKTHLGAQTERCRKLDVRISVIGNRNRIPGWLVDQIETTEARTRMGRKLHVRLAVDYSSRDAILGAAGRLQGSLPSRAAFRDAIAQAMNAPPGTQDVDLFIRTGGETRLSDFLLWESAYAELLFLPCLWPDFTSVTLSQALEEFSTRHRRYGGITEPPPPIGLTPPPPLASWPYHGPSRTLSGGAPKRTNNSPRPGDPTQANDACRTRAEVRDGAQVPTARRRK